MSEHQFGRILNITSVTVKMPIAGLDLSSGARAGLTAFLAGVARSVADRNVTINNVLPGYFDTERLREGFSASAKRTGSSEAEMAQLPPHIARFEPYQALYGGPDGLAVIERLLAQARPYLQPEGVIMLEIGAKQGELALARARHHFPAAHVQVRQDYAARDRLLVIQTLSNPPTA